MISMYVGTGGSGKSYHVTKVCKDWLCKKKHNTVIANFPIKSDAIKGCKGQALFVSDDDMTVDFLVRYSLDNLIQGVESQCIVIFDEAHNKFNCRDFCRKDRPEWIDFFSQHRKFGYDIVLITQVDRMLDKQIRGMVEVEVRHRKMNNYGTGGKLWGLVTGRSTWFIAISYWYGAGGLRLGDEMIRYNKSIASLYDSYRFFTEKKNKKSFLKESAERG